MSENAKLWLKPISRRKFLALGAAVAGGAAALTSLPLGREAVAAGEASKAADEKIIPTSCVHNCGGRCPLYAHVKDGVVIWFSPDQEGSDSPEFPQVRACLRGRG
ncbi:twin-arginine translocation signal domain-containing protein [Neomoorella humiferrea]|uniref:Dimethyl sulfoxide reductase DmsA n=1 Tax=Neomoorella humiferrea TaxID=676965 RepID=A0A2T0AVR3_9FIRM|nr:twin-arginine translocation signal domain-containing protein [Moorella humiferrea]PRR74736.1 Dimethyl sulfoxide reductase DmsA precursor [Moorella humiferrea]